MIDLQKEYGNMLGAAVAYKASLKKAGEDELLAAVPGGVAMAAAKGAMKVGVPMAALWLFTKYLAIPSFVGYAMGHSLAKSTSPNKDDLEIAENNALAKETRRRTEALRKMPTVEPRQSNRDLMTRGGDFGEVY